MSTEPEQGPTDRVNEQQGEETDQNKNVKQGCFIVLGLVIALTLAIAVCTAVLPDPEPAKLTDEDGTECIIHLKVSAEIYLKRVLNDPDSLEIELHEISAYPATGLVLVPYRAKNLFGAYMRQELFGQVPQSDICKDVVWTN